MVALLSELGEFGLLPLQTAQPHYRDRFEISRLVLHVATSVSRGCSSK